MSRMYVYSLKTRLAWTVGLRPSFFISMARDELFNERKIDEAFSV